MQGMKTALIGALVLAAAACGGGAKPDPTAQPMDVQQHDVAHRAAPGGEGAAMGGKGMGEHDEGKMPPTVAKFHDTLAPRWHAEHGAKRMADTCAALPQFHTDAAAIIAAPVPEGADASAWAAGGTQLDASVTALEAPCKANDATAFEPAFERVHTSFHHLLEADTHHE
jgi:hypothetical protein